MENKTNNANVDFAKAEKELREVLEWNIPQVLITDEVKQFVARVAKLVLLYAKKNHDYGNSFNKAYSEFGKIYPLTRMYDKFNRLVKLCKIDEAFVSDETIKDTLDDLACYSIMFCNVLPDE